MNYKIEQVETPTKVVRMCPAVQIGDVFLAHPQLTQEKLSEAYEQAVIRALETDKGQRTVIEAVQGYQLLLPIGKNWLAPMTVRRNSQNQVVALLHYGPS